MIRRPLAALTGLLALAVAGSAAADSPWLRPNVFDATGRDHVTVEASFSESLFEARVAMRSDFFHIVGPNGTTPITGATYLRDVAVFEAPTPVDGLYRLSSGPREGRVGRMYRTDRGWMMVGEEDRLLSSDDVLVEVQSITVAETYVVRGAPDTAALQASGEGLEVFPLSIPTDTVAGEPIVFRATFFGQPLAGAHVTVFRQAGAYDGRSIAAELTTDADGRFSVTAPDAGAYMTQIRHRTESPEGAATPYRSYTHTLTFVAHGD